MTERMYVKMCEEKGVSAADTPFGCYCRTKERIITVNADQGVIILWNG